MCFGYTGAVPDENEIPDYELPISRQTKHVVGNFEKAHQDPLRFIIITLKDGEINIKERIRLAKCTEEDYMEVISRVVGPSQGCLDMSGSGQLACVLHWFRLGDDIKYVRLNFDPDDGLINDENTNKFFDAIEKYLKRKYAKITFMDMRGSTVEQLSVERLEGEFDLLYPDEH